MDHPEKKKEFYEIPKKKATIAGIGFCIAILAIGFIVGYLVSSHRARNLVSSILPLRENNFNYKFIYPLLLYKFGNARYLIENGALEKKLNSYIQTEYQNHTADGIAVYYRNLLNNNWSGINYEVQYHPGSMMKVLVMLAYFRQNEQDPYTFDRTLVYSPNIDAQANSMNYEQQSSLIVGQSYTILQLIEAMIENSDNGADILLLNNVNHKILDDIFNDLSIKNPDETKDFTISATQYSAFLRILYNATYLTQADSEQALSILSKSTFYDGISAGVPKDVSTAQKYGEFVDTDASQKNVSAVELSNCGIIYAPNNPYELCVMTKGAYDGKGQADEQRLASIIKDISGIVYKYATANSNK
jgi:beta-lactamase class A